MSWKPAVGFYQPLFLKNNCPDIYPFEERLLPLKKQDDGPIALIFLKT
jgi:hypothetical protein